MSKVFSNKTKKKIPISAPHSILRNSLQGSDFSLGDFLNARGHIFKQSMQE